MPWEPIDRQLIARTCGDLDDSLTPFQTLAAELGIAEEDVLARLRSYRTTGALRRFGAIVRHQRMGYLENGMTVWEAPEVELPRIGARIAAFPEVSHCYERPPMPDWPYNLYAMVHGCSRPACLAIIARIAEAVAITNYRVLFSTREFKKSSRVYFAEATDE